MLHPGAKQCEKEGPSTGMPQVGATEQPSSSSTVGCTWTALGRQPRQARNPCLPGSPRRPRCATPRCCLRAGPLRHGRRCWIRCSAGARCGRPLQPWQGWTTQTVRRPWRQAAPLAAGQARRVQRAPQGSRLAGPPRRQQPPHRRWSAAPHRPGQALGPRQRPRRPGPAPLPQAARRGLLEAPAPSSRRSLLCRRCSWHWPLRRGARRPPPHRRQPAPRAPRARAGRCAWRPRLQGFSHCFPQASGRRACARDRQGRPRLRRPLPRQRRAPALDSPPPARRLSSAPRPSRGAAPGWASWRRCERASGCRPPSRRTRSARAPPSTRSARHRQGSCHVLAARPLPHRPERVPGFQRSALKVWRTESTGPVCDWSHCARCMAHALSIGRQGKNEESLQCCSFSCDAAASRTRRAGAPGAPADSAAPGTPHACARRTGTPASARRPWRRTARRARRPQRRARRATRARPAPCQQTVTALRQLAAEWAITRLHAPDMQARPSAQAGAPGYEPCFEADGCRAWRCDRDRPNGGKAQASLQVAIKAWPDWAWLSCASPAPGSQRQTRSCWPPRRLARPRRRPRLLPGSRRCPRPQMLGAPAPGRLHLNPWCGKPKGTSAPKEAAACTNRCSVCASASQASPACAALRMKSWRMRQHTSAGRTVQHHAKPSCKDGGSDTHIMQKQHARTAGHLLTRIQELCTHLFNTAWRRRARLMDCLTHGPAANRQPGTRAAHRQGRDEHCHVRRRRWRADAQRGVPGRRELQRQREAQPGLHLQHLQHKPNLAHGQCQPSVALSHSCSLHHCQS